MGKLVILSAALVLLTPALTLGEEPEVDVVWLQNGNRLVGIVLSEDARSVVFQQLSTGRKGQTVAAATLTIPRADVLRIERMSPEARKKVMERSAAFGDRDERLAADLKRIQVKPVDLDGRQGWLAIGRHFEVNSTCAEEFAREVTHYLDEVFTAYRECFDIQRNADRKIKVVLLANEHEYAALQMTLFGRKFENVAFYHSRDNYIVAYNMVQKEEMEQIRKAIIEREAEIKEERSKVRKAEIHLKRTVKEVRSKIDQEVSKARRAIKAGSRKYRAERLRKVEEWKKDALKKLNARKDELKADLKAIRISANEAIDGNRQAIRDNVAVCRARNRSMYEMLFHEGFHAFASNYLWQKNGQSGVPRWLDEGLASYYEMSAVELGDLIHGAPHPGFLTFLKASIKSGKYLPIEKIIEANPFRFFIQHRSQAERATQHYAQSWAIVHYMTDHVSRKSLETYVADLIAGKDNRLAFERMMGEPIEKVSAAVKAHIEKLEVTTGR